MLAKSSRRIPTVDILRGVLMASIICTHTLSNVSPDIRGIFGRACDRLGIDWRPNNRFSVSVARRDSVALLDEFVGPKR